MEIKIAVHKPPTHKTRKQSTPNDTLLLSDGKSTYAELLKRVKNAIKPDQLGVEIKEIHKTRSDKVAIKIANGQDKLQILQDVITKALPDATTNRLDNNKVLHICELDAVTSSEEIGEAVCTALKAEREEIQVRALRPAYGNTQKATIILKAELTQKLIESHKKLKIGWTYCRVRLRQDNSWCSTCWKEGHRSQECKGPDRTKLCMRCGKEGHKRLQCQNQVYCLDCGAEGEHRTTRCPKPNSTEKDRRDLPFQYRRNQRTKGLEEGLNASDGD